MRAMLHHAISVYPAAVAACTVLALFCLIFVAWTFCVFDPKRKVVFDRGERLPFDNASEQENSPHANR
jgi:cbb3-type cytochrome oxidase subunit 3